MSNKLKPQKGTKPKPEARPSLVLHMFRNSRNSCRAARFEPICALRENKLALMRALPGAGMKQAVGLKIAVDEIPSTTIVKDVCNDEPLAGRGSKEGGRRQQRAWIQPNSMMMPPLPDPLLPWRAATRRRGSDAQVMVVLILPGPREFV